MPIAVKDYTWRETEKEVVIVLPLKGVSPSKADILTTERYIKVHYPPYLFEAYLEGEVVEERCSVKLGNGTVQFNLVKKEGGVWGRLVALETEEDRHVLAEKRAEAVETVGKTASQLKKVRAEKKREEEKFAVREQMRLEQEERERIEGEKQNEREKADRELQRWKEEKKTERERKRAEEARPAKKNKKTLNNSKKKVTFSSAPIWTKSDENGKNQEKKAPPPPRGGGSITIQFTPRVFPTAARESKEAEEQEWLAKQAAARRITPSGPEDDPNERNPELLKDRGIRFFKAKNYDAAINVFSEAISLNPSLPQLFSNRAASYLARGNLEPCISDCCRALELYYPAVSANQTPRAKVFARRGAAYVKIGELGLAVQDYEEAVKLLPGDQKLQDDLSRLQRELIKKKK